MNSRYSTEFWYTQWFFWKHIKQRGKFRAKVGFPVDKSFVLVLSEDRKKVAIRHPKPILISCELLAAPEIVGLGDWWLFSLTADDWQTVNTNLLNGARDKAMSPEVLEMATRNLSERIKAFELEEGLKVTMEPLP